MIGTSKIIFLLFVSVAWAVQAHDSAGVELTKLTDDMNDEYEKEREIEKERQSEVVPDGDDQSLNHYHVQRLNSTQRRMLEEALKNVTEELKLLEVRIAARQSNPADISSEQKLDTESDEASESLTELNRRKVEMRQNRNILTAIKIVDDEVNKEVEVSPETRKKRSLQRKSSLKSITEELKIGSKQLENDTAAAAPRRTRKKRPQSGFRSGVKHPSFFQSTVKQLNSSRATLEALPSTICSLGTNLVEHMSMLARAVGGTIQVGVEGNVGIVISVSAAAAYTYGPNGEFGCTTTLCRHLTSNGGISGGVMAGYYYNFADVAGQSFVTLWSAGYSYVQFTYGTIETKKGRKIGDVIGVSVGITGKGIVKKIVDRKTGGKTGNVAEEGVGRVDGKLDFSSGKMSCNTTMTKPNCSRTMKSYQEKYYVSCGSGYRGKSRVRYCPKYRTLYRYHYNC